MKTKTVVFVLGAVGLIALLQNIHPGSRPMRNDQMAIHVIEQLHAAEASFYLKNSRYATLDELGPKGAGLVSAEVASGQSQGFRFELTVQPGQYRVKASPLRPFVTGYRTFSSDRTRVLSYSFAKGG
jgi:hypothetical protein